MLSRLTDMGNAEALIEQFGDDLRYCPQIKEWYVWDGRRWHEDVGKSIIQKAKEVARSYSDAADKLPRQLYDGEHPQRKGLLKHATSSESLRSIQSMITLAQSDSKAVMDLRDFDHDPNLLCVQNGVIELGTQRFRGFSRDDNITKLAPVIFREGATSAKWEKFLVDVIPDPDTRDFIQRAVGYSLTGHTHAEIMFLLYGRGQNGKTTFTGTILNMLGEYASQASSSALMHRNGDGPSNALYVLIGKRFVSAAETGESYRLDENLVKQMTGMDRISVNPKYKSQIEFMPTWKIWLSTNHEPIIRGNDTAIWRRMRKIPFEVVIPESKRDPNLKLALLYDIEERSGILNWALEGVRRWQEDGLEPSQQVREATNAYRADQDVIGQFLTDRCQAHSQLTIFKATIYKAYREYCKGLDEKPKTKVSFGRQLREIGIKDDRNRNKRYWVGIGLDERVNLFPHLFEE